MPQDIIQSTQNPSRTSTMKRDVVSNNVRLVTPKMENNNKRLSRTRDIQTSTLSRFTTTLDHPSSRETSATSRSQQKSESKGRLRDTPRTNIRGFIRSGK
jgi:hypothetical protein